jgi:hypothetical protein
MSFLETRISGLKDFEDLILNCEDKKNMFTQIK